MRQSATKKHPLQNTWSSIKTRCFNANHKDFPYYGGRGITMCEEWKNSFQKFVLDMGLPPSDDKYQIDRIDNSGNYEPSNCRWRTIKQNGNNKRNNHFVTIENVTKTISEWSDQLGMDQRTFRCRVVRGINGNDLLKPKITYPFSHCKHGHELSGNNLMIGKKNGKQTRRCRICTNASNRKYKSMRRASK